MGSRTTVAVVGSGISGLSSAWILNRSGYKVTLFEENDLFGGHTLTETSGPVPVDLGFQVFNLTTYPNLVGFFDCLGVDHEPSEMSFSCSVDDGQLEWGSEGFNAIFAQKRNLVSWKFWVMLYEVIRFGRAAPKVLEPASSAKYRSMTLGEYVEEEKYSDTFKNCYLMPMCASVWSVSFNEVSKFPVVALVQFWVNHHLLDIFQRPRWRVVKNQGQAYVKKVIESLPDVRNNHAVTSVVSGTNGKLLVTTKAGCEEFDKVVLATHSDVSLKLLGSNVTNAERRLLSALPYQKNIVYYHTDAEYMPKVKSTWSSWNFLGKTRGDIANKPVSLTYWCNRLQNLSNDVPDLFVTLNPWIPPAKSKIIRKLELYHNVLSLEAIDAQNHLDEIQGVRGIYFAGAWCGYGFHEDGIKSALRVADLLHAQIPWNPRTTSPKMNLGDYFYMRLFNTYAKSAIIRGSLRIILPNGDELVYGNGETKHDVEAWRGAPPLQSTLRVFDMKMFKKCVTRHDTGLAEAFMNGDFEATDLGGLMAIAATNASELSDQQGLLGLLNWVDQKWLYLKHKARSNTILGSRKNIKAHYDAGNDMYRLFLDKSMTYSCAIHSPEGSLFDAQMAKLDALIRMAKIDSTDHVLEIGCGWGSFAIRAAQTTGCRVTGLTLSRAQLVEAQTRVKTEGLDDQINLIYCDYREAPGEGTYDKLVSCEMIEAVGEEHLDSFFKCIGKMLKPGGIAVLQAISVPDERYALRMMNAVDIGPDYAVTLRNWRSEWEAKKSEVLALGYSESFWRMYRMYFAYCEGGFDAKCLRNYQVCLQRDLSDEGSLSQSTHDAPIASTPFSVEVDSITQVLLAVYFFLAGLACSYHRYLWITPITTVLFTALSYIISTIASGQRFYSRLSNSEKFLWCNSLMQLIFSGIVGILSISELNHLSSSTILHSSSQKGALIIICSTMGFAGYQLWSIVRHKLYHQRTKSFWYFTMLLCLFATAATKQEHTNLLASMMIGEWFTVFYMARKLLLPFHFYASLNILRFCMIMECITFILFRLVPHFLLFLLVIWNKFSFQSPIFYWMALGGIAQCNLTNFHRMREALLTSMSNP